MLTIRALVHVVLLSLGVIACNSGGATNTVDPNANASCDTTLIICKANSRCDDSSGQAMCVCDAGYQDNNNNQLCKPTCATAELTCETGASCDDSTGFSVCTCLDGMQDNDKDGLCLPNCDTPAICHAGAICLDTTGVAVCTCDSGAFVAHDDDWTQVASLDVDGVSSVTFHPLNGTIVFGTRHTTTDGIWEWDLVADTATKLAVGDKIASVVVDADGDIFWMEDYGGSLYRSAYPHDATAEEWVAQWHPEDGDGLGIVIVPNTYTGSVVPPGTGLMVDRGGDPGTPDEIWTWDPAQPNGEAVLHADDGTLVDGTDLAVSDTTIWVIDAGDDQPGSLWTIEANGALTEITLAPAIGQPRAIVLDPLSGDLFVSDEASGQVLRLGPTGVNVPMLAGFSIEWDNISGLGISAEGKLVVATKTGLAVFVGCSTGP